MFNFEKLTVWQKAVVFAGSIYRLTASFPGAERFGLTNQIRRAASSIASMSQKVPPDPKLISPNSSGTRMARSVKSLPKRQSPVIKAISGLMRTSNFTVTQMKFHAC